MASAWHCAHWSKLGCATAAPSSAAITNTFSLSSWQIGAGQVLEFTTGGTGHSRT